MTLNKTLSTIIVLLLFTVKLSIAQTVLLAPQQFNYNVIVNYTSSTQWHDLGSNPIQYYSSGGCDGGYAGFSGSWNNYFWGSLRSPVVNCSGQSSVVLKFNFSNSYDAQHTQNSIRFYLWDINTSSGSLAPYSIKINNVENPVSNGGINYIYFNKLRSCDTVTVYFDFANYSTRSACVFYLEPMCSYNDGNVYSVTMDNIEVLSNVSTGINTNFTNSGLDIIQKSSNQFSVINSASKKTAMLSVYSIDGKLQNQFQIEGNSTKNISLSDYPKGICFIRLTGENNVITKKLFLQ